MEKWWIGLMMGGLLVACGVRESTPREVQGLLERLDRDASEEVFRAWVKDHGEPWVEGERITFLFWDEKASRVVLEIASGRTKSQKVDLKRYKKTPLFVVTLPLEEGKVFDYSFVRFDEQTPQGKRLQDPLHPYVAYTRPLMSRFVLPGEKKGRLVIFSLKPVNGLSPRKIFVYLPWDYDRTTNRYPVVYMQDGQNLWDSPLANFGGWKVDTTLDRLIAQERIRPVIVVGIENSASRAEEYVGFSAYYGLQESYDTNEQKRVVAYAEKYRDFVVNQLIPFITTNYRVSSEEITVAGSSFGAGVSLYLGFSRPDIFRGIGAFSFGNYDKKDVNRGIRRVLQVQPYLSDHLLSPDGKHRVYLDCGGRGIDMIFVQATRKLREDMLKKGWQEEKDLLYVEDPTADHNEMAWAGRFERFSLFMWGK